MDHAEESPNQVAGTVFWIMFGLSMAFIISVVILIR